MSLQLNGPVSYKLVQSSELGNTQTVRLERRHKILKNRNDHSIQKKSPIRLPDSTPKKSQLTFRLRNEQDSNTLDHTKALNQCKLNDTISVSRMSIGSKKSTLSQKEHHHDSIKNTISLEEYDLIDHLWETTIQLGNCNNPMFSKFIFQLQSTLRQMFKSFAYAKLDEEVLALASSQKIKLQNFQMNSCYDKQVNKEYEYEDSRVSEKQTEISSCLNKVNCQQSNTKEKISQRKTASSLSSENGNKSSPKEQTQEFELKKILYMIEGKQKQTKSDYRIQQPISSAKKANSGNIYYESYSSFNQNPSEDSGYTIMEIDKQNDNYDSNTIKEEGEISSQISVRSIRSNLSSRPSNKSEPSSKHKVLQDIIGMLNKKYNKNIQLN